MLTAFDTSNITAIKARLMSQSFLRHSEDTPSGADTSTKNVEVRVHPLKSRTR